MPRILLRHFDEFNPAAHMSRKHKLTHSRDGRVSVCAFPVALLVDLMPIESEPIFRVYTQWLQPILAQICREIFRAGLEPSWLSPMRRTVPCFRQMNCPSAYPRPRRINDYVILQILEFTQTMIHGTPETKHATVQRSADLACHADLGTRYPGA